MGTSDTNKMIVKGFFAALNSGDVDSIVNTYADVGYVQTMGNTLISGKASKEEIRAAVSGIYAVFPKGLKFTVLGMIAEDEKVAVEAESEGEHISGNDRRGRKGRGGSGERRGAYIRADLYQ
jgi:ketosteroid isomerase-like protein